jgi:ribosomal protein S12 methylthiotransferase accessory factor
VLSLEASPRPDVSPQVENLLELVSPRCGLVRSLNRMARGIDEPTPPILYYAQLASYDFKSVKPVERAAAGKGLTDDEAIGAAIGEAVERYCAAHVDESRLERMTIAAAGTDAVTPGECVLYSPTQYARHGFRYLPESPDFELEWVRGRELPQDREVLVPASLVYLYGAASGSALAPSTSNGLAAGPTLDAAVRGGLLELIERDAFLVTWLNRLPAPEIDLAEVGGTAREIQRHHARFGFTTRVFDITLDVPIPVMLAVSCDPSRRGPAFTVGLGCHLEPATAVLRSLFELCQARLSEGHRFREARGAGPSSARDVRTLDDHSALFWSGERARELDFLLDSGRRRSLADVRSLATGTVDGDREAVVAALRSVGCRVAYVDLTTPDVAQYDVKVVRAIATGLQPIHFGFGEERLGGSRPFELPAKLGYSAGVLTEADLNPCPHPLA